MENLLRKFDKDSAYKNLYVDFMNEFKTLKHIRKISPTSVGPPLACYIPHHGIVKLKTGIQKIRVVFNGSSRTSSNTSLNDILHTGQKLQIDITDTLLYFRSHRFVFLTDIVKMFRQILIHPDDWDLHCILWINSQQKILAYHLTTVIYGTRATPFLAGRVMLQLLQDEGHRFPLATEPMTKGRYVDDMKQANTVHISRYYSLNIGTPGFFTAYDETLKRQWCISPVPGQPILEKMAQGKLNNIKPLDKMV